MLCNFVAFIRQRDWRTDGQKSLCNTVRCITCRRTAKSKNIYLQPPVVVLLLTILTTNTQKYILHEHLYFKRLLVLSLLTPPSNGGSMILWEGCQARETSIHSFPVLYLASFILSTFSQLFLFHFPWLSLLLLPSPRPLPSFFLPLSTPSGCEANPIGYKRLVANFHYFGRYTKATDRSSSLSLLQNFHISAGTVQSSLIRRIKNRCHSVE